MTRSDVRTRPVSVEDLFAPPERGRPSISPDGRRLAFLAPWRSRLNVWVVDLGAQGQVDLDRARRVTADDHRPVIDHRWTDDPRFLLYLQDDDGDENHHVFRVDLDDPEAVAVDLTPYPGARVWEMVEVPGLPGSVVVSLNHVDPARIDLCELDVATGGLTVLAEGGDGASWFVTSRRELYEVAVTEDGWELRQGLDDGGRRVVATFAGDDFPYGPMTHPAPDGAGLWFGAYGDHDQLAPARLDLATGEVTEIDRHPTHDLDTISVVAPLLPSPWITDRASGELVGVRYSRERQVIHPLTPGFAEVLAALEPLSDGDLGPVTSDRSGRFWVASFLHDRNPSSWLYDHTTGEARPLFRPLGRIDPEALAPTRPVSVTARDGLELPSYLTLPVGWDREEHTPPPLVLMPHGGPWFRDVWSLDLQVQYFATRGYAVLRPQFRGSTGFGRRHLQAAVGEFGGAMHDDLVDAVEWTVTHGYADPARVAIFGGSYGGYAALVGVTSTPHLFAAAVDYVGVSDLAATLRSFPEAVRPGLRHNFHRYVGDPDVPEQEADMLARSPIRHLDRVETPLMIFQGANDVRVRQSESDNVVERLRGRGVEVAYRVFADEGHAFVNPENLMTMFREAGEFLARHLGGRP
ncbi:S9 family peptidase [Actinomycetospora sp. NBRC 106378]|uniref:alpha/beta hydrolase family protein n=1 Tax=Actinomycetospora sp. NBRC 106378 TaxID=3032208 RepID=UPI0024A365C6|nr:S9 family peptidase [Actinomycetospora sp. NBRC 106378]GLZ52010.1 putative peptidase [Actinomycetospora sp. NBRC 106378]